MPKLDSYSIDDIISVEDKLSDVCRFLRQVRDSMKEHGLTEMEIGLRTTLIYAEWMEEWVERERGRINARLVRDARKKQRKTEEK